MWKSMVTFGLLTAAFTAAAMEYAARDTPQEERARVRDASAQEEAGIGAADLRDEAETEALEGFLSQVPVEESVLTEEERTAGCHEMTPTAENRRMAEDYSDVWCALWEGRTAVLDRRGRLVRTAKSR